MEQEDEVERRVPEVSASGQIYHGAGAGLGLVGMILGFGIFSFSFIIGFYLWSIKHNFEWFVGAITIGYTVSFVLRRMSVRS